MSELDEDGTRSGPPSRGGPPWPRGGGWRAGGRPPWWPEDEPFPPRGAYPWRGMRSRFLRRVALGFGLFFLALFATSALVGALVSGSFHPQRHHGLVPVAGLLGVGLLVGLV